MTKRETAAPVKRHGMNARTAYAHHYRGRRPVAARRATLFALSLSLVYAFVPPTAIGQNTTSAQTWARPSTRSRALRKHLTALMQHDAPRPDDTARRKHWANYHTCIANARFTLERYPYAVPIYLDLVERDLASARYARRVLAGDATDRIRVGQETEGYYAVNDDSFQPFLRYLPPSAKTNTAPMAMVVFLHGYFPSMNRVNWQYIPDTLREFARTEGICVVAPFGRSNTDYQGIGEQDVLRVIDAMQRRYRIDASRIFLAGVSMGGMGTWTMGARYPDRFAGLIPVCGRADYYFWHDVARQAVPSYKRRLIDAAFGHPLMSTLTNVPVFCLHGDADMLIPVREARHAVSIARQRGVAIRYVEIPGGSHWIFEDAFARPDVRRWITTQQRTNTATAPPRTTGLSASRIQQAFLDRFAFISASPGIASASDKRFAQAAADWQDYAKSSPRLYDEADIRSMANLRGNLFLFGEPEESPAIRAALRNGPITVTNGYYTVGRRRFPRAGHGLYVARPSPWRKGRTVVVQCGIPRGAALSFNHKYDFLPDFIVYSRRTDEDGANIALCAGFYDGTWSIDPARLYTRSRLSQTNAPRGAAHP